VIRTAVATSSAGTGRMDTTSGPDNSPAGRQGRSVRYMGTFVPASMCRTGTSASSSAASKVKLHPMRKQTRSSRQWEVTSATSATGSPSSYTR
jgi:hypothetical protein